MKVKLIKIKISDKKLRIKRDFHQGKLRKLENGVYGCPSEYFVLGITPRLVHETIKDIEFDEANKEVSE